MSRRDTLLVEPTSHGGPPHGVNPPVYRASSVVFDSLAAFEAGEQDPYAGFYYGRYGTPTNFAFEEAMARLDGGYKAISVASGHAAFTAVLLGLLSPGDHVVVADWVYGPTRKLCDGLLTRLGIQASFFDASDPEKLAAVLQPNTRVVFLEIPGSLTLEVLDTRALAEVAHRRNCHVVVDNSWATPLLFRPLEHGADVTLVSATKYVAGHSDCMVGVITTTEELYPAMRRAVSDLGACAAPDVCYLAHRGLRTLSVRLERQGRNALALAAWLEQHPKVGKVMHPGLPGADGHALFLRDFDGPSGVFSILLRQESHQQLASFIDHLKFFKLGVSWGGFESLVYPADPSVLRTARPWKEQGRLVRLSVGLEDVADLQADLDRALNAV